MQDFTEKNIWNVFRAYYKEESIVENQIRSFNEFILNGMQKIVNQDSTIKFPDYTIKFGQITVDTPSVIEEDRVYHKIFPSDARLRDLNYEGNICIDISETFEKDGQKEEMFYMKQIIGKMPVMVKSCVCNLKKLNDIERIKNDECPNDTGGYFIIKGNERVLVGQLRGNYNKPFVLKQKNINKNKYIAEVRSMSNETGHSVLIQAILSSDDRTISFSLPYIKDYIPAGIVFKSLGYITKEEIAGLIGLDDNKSKAYIRYIINDAYNCKTKEDALEYIGKRSLNIIPEEKRVDYANQIVEIELFPHLGISGTIKENACYLGNMVKKLILTNNGERKEDDRDNYSNKRVEVSGTLMYEIFRNLFKKFISTIKIELEKRKQRPDLLSILSRIRGITKGLVSCLSTGNWGIQKNTYVRIGVSQILDRMTYSSTISHLRRLVIPVGKDGKNTAMRQIHGSSFGMVCPCETPEGGKVGIVLNFSLITRVTKGVPVVNVKKVLEKIKNMINIQYIDVCNLKNYVPIFLNDIIIGYSEDVQATISEIRKLRKIGFLDKEVSVSFDCVDKDIKIYCDEGRFSRPFYTLTDNKLNIPVQDVYDWKTLIKKGHIQYLDSLEIENSVICMNPKNLNRQRNDYCELHPVVMFGIIAAMIPFPDHSQSPRNCYQCSMGKQALGVPTLNYNIRTDTLLYVLHYAQKPIVFTKIAEITKFNEMPSGINAVVAIASYAGFGQEDSVIVNQSSVERGLFCLTSYKTIHYIDKKKEEKICIPPVNSENVDPDKPGYFRRKNANYSLLDENGVIMQRYPVKDREYTLSDGTKIKLTSGSLGTSGTAITVKPGDVLIGKVITNVSKTGEETKIDSSLVVQSGEGGIIDRVYVCTTPSGYKLIKIVIRENRCPTLGDKLACYDPETDVLTSNGWIPISQVTKNHNVACLVEGKRMEFHKPTEVQSYDYKGKMYRVNSDKVDLLVTPNHRMYVGSNKRNNYKMKKAEDIYGKTISYKNNCEETQFKHLHEYFILPQSGKDTIFLPMREWCIFLGIWFAEGSCSVKYKENGNVHYRSVSIAANKQRVRDELEKCMEKLPFKWNLHMSKGELVKWYTSNLGLINYLHPLSVGAINKSLPGWCFFLNMELSRCLIKGMILGDGNYMKGTTTERYYTSSIKLRDDFQRLCINAGWGCNYYLKSPKGTKSMCLGKEIATNSDYWNLTVVKSQTNPLVNKYLKQGKQLDSWEEYDGKVYCCSVPTDDGIIMVRRGGKNIWCGNSKAAQKGTIGMMFRQEDMPFTSSGIVPDIIINPLCIPSRMTINQLVECILGKKCCQTGEYGDATPFTEYSKNVADKITNEIGNALGKFNFERHGWETMYNGMTGEMINAKIFIGPTYYQRLKHMVVDKIYARSTGLMTQLTRQPTEGRSREGGLRFGEMEKDAIVAYGASEVVNERLYTVSDEFAIYVCKKCGIIAASTTECQCKCDKIVKCKFPYASKLLLTELMSIGIKVKIVPDDE